MEASLTRSSYEQELKGYHLLASKACAVTVIVLVLLGMVLDYAVYPNEMMRFGLVRAGTSLAVLAALALLYTSYGQRHVHAVTFIWLTFPQLMIAWMIHVTEGESSLFYAGIILTIFAVGTLFPVGYKYTLGFGLLTLLMFYLACALRPQGIVDHSQFLFHGTIILFAVLGSTVYTYFNERDRRQLFALKDELAQKNGELEQTNRSLADIKGQMLQQEKMAALGTLSAGLLHEVNNPVNFCLMAIELASEDPAAKASATLAECLADAKQGMQRVQYIVSDLKTFAYRKSGADYDNVQFLFERALDAAVRLVGHELKGVEVRRSLPGDTMARGDEAAIIGVLINLLSNAALALRRSGTPEPVITVSATADGERLRVAVEDNGPGIAPENIGRVFEPFFTTSEVGQGLGLGLSICYSVVQRHGGLLSVESVPNVFTRFSFDLPRAAGGER
ncbi:sensor histidine kinase [Massilia endophytica]|uniref:sensor histidine kinase n=1 Tax=Massilia endophytica TaxID=2899220 RepID=UPI001E38B610|nr:ATP-binding protein [Massilia endophytica]UGQ48649.1 ATP-binding protein [Massilia endophytica]